MLLRLSGAEGRVSGREIAFRWLLVAVGSPHAAAGVPVCALWVRRREGVAGRGTWWRGAGSLCLAARCPVSVLSPWGQERQREQEAGRLRTQAA